jgi:hypothetical protein
LKSLLAESAYCLSNTLHIVIITGTHACALAILIEKPETNYYEY